MSRQRAREQNSSWPRLLPWIGLGVTIVVNALTIGYTYGGVSFRLQAVEHAAIKLEKKVEDFGALSTDMAVVKNQLQTINATLGRLERAWSPKNGDGK